MRYNSWSRTNWQSQSSGIKLFKKTQQENAVTEILKLSCEWFQNNLENPEAILCKEYLHHRKLSQDTIFKFKLVAPVSVYSSLFSNDVDKLKIGVTYPPLFVLKGIPPDTLKDA